jgi:hypothetical protein
MALKISNNLFSMRCFLFLHRMTVGTRVSICTRVHAHVPMVIHRLVQGGSRGEYPVDILFVQLVKWKRTPITCVFLCLGLEMHSSRASPLS